VRSRGYHLPNAIGKGAGWDGTREEQRSPLYHEAGHFTQACVPHPNLSALWGVHSQRLTLPPPELEALKGDHRLKFAGYIDRGFAESLSVLLRVRQTFRCG